jgi:hypothetical protein
MQTHPRMSALINRRTAFIGLNWNFHFPTLSTVAPTRGRLSRGKFEAGFQSKGLSTLPQQTSSAWR